MGIWFKLIVCIIVLFVFFNTIVYRSLVRIERKKQEEFLKTNFDEDELKLYYNILDFHDSVMKKKVYIIPEISVKVSRNNFNPKRYVVPLFFNIIDSNSRFDYYCDKLFYYMKLNDTIGDLHIKASILEIIEKYLGKSNFRKKGDLIFGIDLQSNRHKFYLDTAENQLESLEWNNSRKNFYNKKIYRNATNIKKIAETVNKLDLPSYFHSLFPESNWDRCLYRNNIQKDLNNTIKENIDSYHIYLKEPVNISENKESIKKMIYNIYGTAGYDTTHVDEWLDNNNNNQIHWIAVNFHEDENLELNLYVRRNSKIDKTLRIMQKVLFWYLLI